MSNFAERLVARSAGAPPGSGYLAAGAASRSRASSRSPASRLTTTAECRSLGRSSGRR